MHVAGSNKGPTYIYVQLIIFIIMFASMSATVNSVLHRNKTAKKASNLDTDHPFHSSSLGNEVVQVYITGVKIKQVSSLTIYIYTFYIKA